MLYYGILIDHLEPLYLSTQKTAKGISSKASWSAKHEWLVAVRGRPILSRFFSRVLRKIREYRIEGCKQSCISILLLNN